MSFRRVRASGRPSLVATSRGGPLPDRAAVVLQRGSALQQLGDFAHEFAVDAGDAEFILAEAEAFANTMEKLVGSTV